MIYHRAKSGIFKPEIPVVHRDHEYQEVGFDTFSATKEDHFWYRGRHRFLLKALDRVMLGNHYPLQSIDLGGGVLAGGYATSRPTVAKVLKRSCCPTLPLLRKEWRKKIFHRV